MLFARTMLESFSLLIECSFVQLNGAITFFVSLSFALHVSLWSKKIFALS